MNIATATIVGAIIVSSDILGNEKLEGKLKHHRATLSASG